MGLRIGVVIVFGVCVVDVTVFDVGALPAGLPSPFANLSEPMLPRESIATASVVPPKSAEPTESSPVRLFWNGLEAFENVTFVADPLALMWPIAVVWTAVRPVVPTIGNWYSSAAEPEGMNSVGTLRAVSLGDGKSVERSGSWLIETTSKFRIVPLTTRLIDGSVNGPVGIVPSAITPVVGSIVNAVLSYEVL